MPEFDATTNYLIWSNEHSAWWRQNRHGYTSVIQWAGVFGEREALQILADASRGAQARVWDPIGTYADATVPNEVLVPLTAEGHPGGPDCPPRMGSARMSFTCPRCERTSYSLHDAREGYCGACHDWTAAPRGAI